MHNYNKIFITITFIYCSSPFPPRIRRQCRLFQSASSRHLCHGNGNADGMYTVLAVTFLRNCAGYRYSGDRIRSLVSGNDECRYNSFTRSALPTSVPIVPSPSFNCSQFVLLLFQFASSVPSGRRDAPSL